MCIWPHTLFSHTLNPATLNTQPHIRKVIHWFQSVLHWSSCILISISVTVVFWKIQSYTETDKLIDMHVPQKILFPILLTASKNSKSRIQTNLTESDVNLPKLFFFNQVHRSEQLKELIRLDMCLWNTDAPGGNKVKIWQKSLSPTFWPRPIPRGMWCQWSVRNP